MQLLSMTLRQPLAALLCAGLLSSAVALRAEAPAPTGDGPIPIKVVIVTMFELGEITGDTPGEFQFWVERLPLDATIPFPQGHRDLRYNAEMGVLGLVTGIGTLKSSASIMGLGMDPRFDLSQAYWLVAGISGADPLDMSLGSAAWADWLVDGDLSHQIHPDEAPEDWQSGYLPLFAAEPFPDSVRNEEGIVYQLNTGLVDWAYALTKDVEIPDTEPIQALRERYEGFPEAQKPPSVLRGDQLAAMTFWHGELLNTWANDWVRYWTGGEGNFLTSAMEDTGTKLALSWLDNAGKVDSERLLVLRTASNFTMQHPGQTALQSLSGENAGDYSGFIPSLEAAYRVGSVAVRALVEDWERYATELPTAD